MIRSSSSLPLVFAGLALLGGCNRYEMFRLSGFQQESFSNRADLLFVMDNSDSMMEESIDLANNFEAFVNGLVDEESIQTEDLGDATANYIRQVKDRGSFINFQLAITTTDIGNDYGGLKGDLRSRGDSGVADGFISDLVCNATCFCDPAEVGCVIPSSGTVTRDFLDDTCGEGNWARQNCGSGAEEGLEAVFMAMCRSVAYPPDDCFDPIQPNFEVADVESNAGMLRENSTLIPVIITDEGDVSRRVSQGDAFPEAYEELFAKFYKRTSWVVIGPDYDQEDNSFPCPSGATNWGTLRYQAMVENSGGLYIPITDSGCGTADFADALDQVGELLKSLLDAFPLQSIPQIDTIIVMVDGESIPRAPETENPITAAITYGDGWSYRASDNAVVMHGSAVPDYNADVRIYYLPQEGKPRELPF